MFFCNLHTLRPYFGVMIPFDCSCIANGDGLHFAANMAKIKSKNFKSKIPPPSWDQVVWLSALGAIQLFSLFLASLYNKSLLNKTDLNSFDTLFGYFYSFWAFMGLFGVGALVLAAIKTVNLLRMSAKKKPKKAPAKKPRKKK